MSLWLAALMAASGLVTLPSARDQAMGLTPDDYPRGELRSNKNGTVHFRVMFGPNGKPQSCDILYATMSERDQKQWCFSVKSFSMHRDIRGPEGEPTHFLLVGTWFYLLPEYGKYKPVPRAPDLVSDLPELSDEMKMTLADKPKVKVNVAVDETGGLTRCNSNEEEKRKELGELLCEHLKDSWTAMPERNAAGQLVPYIRALDVEVNAGRPTT